MNNLSFPEVNEENLVFRCALFVVALITVGCATTACVGPASAPENAPETGEWRGTGPESLSLRNGKLRGNDGCNGIGGSYTAQDGTIVATLGLSTKMACPGVDTWLRGIATATVADDTMTVYNHVGERIGTLTRAA